MLHVVGDGEHNYTSCLKKIVEELDLKENVIFYGYVSEAERVYENIDILLNFAKDEAMGRVTAEAMAFGIPVIGLKSGATTELIQHGINGLLFSSEEEFLTHSSELIRNKELYKTMSKEAKESAMRRFTTEKYGEEVFNNIYSLVGN